MNFLLHYDFACIELPARETRPVAAVGAMLPDLWRMADRRVRPRDAGAVRAETDADSRLAALLDGIGHHLDIDRWFHRSRSFVVGEKKLRSRFFETKSPKLLLFAHAAWEMCLDGAFVRERGVRSLAAELSASFDAAAPYIGRAADLHHFTSRGEAVSDRLRFDERMTRIQNAGKDGALFEDYSSANGIARRVAGMRAAFGLGVPSPKELEAWSRALDSQVEAAGDALLELRHERAVDLAARTRDGHDATT